MRLLRTLGWLALALAALLLGILFWQWAEERLAWRDAVATIEADGAEYDYSVVRDEWGVPTIYGASDPDTAFGLAYAHAEDDFATIQERMAVVRSDLGRIQGRKGTEADYLGHLLDARRITREGYDRLSPEGLAMARAYADGLNTYAVEHPDEVLLARLFPVTERDIVEGFVLVSPLFFGLDGVIGDLVEGRNLDMSATFGDSDSRGSNAFALNGNRTADGSTILVSNSHQPWRGVVAWYEARVASGEGWSMSGVTFPGVPTILMGHNRHLGWTNTVNDPDMVDVYKLALDETGNRYRYGGEWRELDRRRVWLRVKMGPFIVPIPRTFERSVHGPVIRNSAGAFAFRYGGEGETRHLDQYYRLMRTASLAEWREVMSMQAIPGTNFIYADAAGNIAMLYNARLPERAVGIDWSGVLPGDDPSLVWSTYEPPEDIPFLLNPPSGFVFNANNTPLVATAPADDFVTADFPDLVGIETRMTNRARRAQDLLSADRSITLDDLHAIKMDTVMDRSTLTGRTLASTIAADPEVEAALAGWDWSFDGEGEGDALALAVLHEVWGATYYSHLDGPGPKAAAEAAKAHMMEHFGELDPPLGDFLRLREGDADLPLAGAPGVLRAIHSRPAEDGRFVAWNGDTFIMTVVWPEDGGPPTATSIVPHGAAAGRPKSPHHADQAEMFAAGRYKPAPLPNYEDRPK